MANGPDDTDQDLLRRANQGEEAALATLFGHYRKRLRQMVHLRLDRRLQGRVDPSDVLQEAGMTMADADLPDLDARPRATHDSK